MLKRLFIYTAFLSLLAPAVLQAQSNKLRNQPKYDNRVVHFGFCLGLNTYNFQIREKADLASVPGVYNIWSTTAPGYSIGIISNLRLGTHFDFRFIPTFSSTVRHMHVDMENPYTMERDVEDFEIESSFIQFPFELKFKSQRINNHRWYVLGGFQYSIDLASKEKVDDDTIFKIKKNNMDYQVGVGIDIYFEYFKFSPQLKGSFGINNLLVEDGTVQSSGIDQLLSRCILINFTFE